MSPGSNKTFFYLRIILFAVYLINGIISIPRNSMVSDEMDNWSYSRRIMKGHPEKVYTYDDGPAMAIGILNTIPRSTEQITHPGLQKTDGGISDVMHGRYITLIVSLLIGIYIFKWSKELFGEAAGMFSLFLFVFCPNLNANAILISYDNYTALFSLTSFYYFWKFVNESGNKNFLLFSTSIALAQISKYSLIHLLVIFGVISILILLKRKSLKKTWKKNLMRLVIFCCILLLIINAAYLFQGCGQTLSSYHFRSSVFQSIQSVHLIREIPLPFPVPYIEGFDITFHSLELGPGNPLVAGSVYLLGQLRTGQGFWYYYLIVFLFKTPIPFLLILLISAGIYVKQRKFSIQSPGFIISIGLLYYFFIFSFLNTVQIGIRHILFVYPLLYVMAAKISLLKPGKAFNILLLFFTVYYVSTFYYFFPNLISYSNELIMDKKYAYKIMADSNIDYGQGWYTVENYLKTHPDIHLADTIAKQGKFLIRVNDYLDINGNHKYSWLSNFKPMGHVDHSFLLFNIKEEDLIK